MHTHVSFGWGERVLAILLALVLGVALILSGFNRDAAAQAGGQYKPVKAVGEMGSVEDIEAEFGAVNQKAALEPKDGLFSRIRARRQAVACQPQYQQRAAGYCTPTMVQQAPAYAYSAPIQPQAYVHPQYVYTAPACNTGCNAVISTPTGSRVVAPIVTPAPAQQSSPSPVDCKDGSCKIVNGLKIILSK